jgi:hypothetical protein
MVEISDVSMFKDALCYFEMMERKIEDINNEYLDEITQEQNIRIKNIYI